MHRRIEAVVQLDAVRRSRDTVRRLELVAQQTNHESLESARGELANQSRWADEIRTLVEDAARDGVERARLDDTDDDQDDEEEEGGQDLDGREGVGRDIRVQTYRLQVRSSPLLPSPPDRHSLTLVRRTTQLARLTTSTLASEARVHSLLHRLRSAQALSTTRAELSQLQRTANQATVWLSELSVERARLSRDLKSLEGERREAEGRRVGVVLDLVLRWDEERRDAMDEDERRWREVEEGVERLGIV
ncbi:MAG: hypothetical protein O7C59_10795 [Rickettsia endosymbiont of Ixodes persulcatus]|nr:hypothetical protein [Rickettsia endosymbiont of Ixodes persulcatus]